MKMEVPFATEDDMRADREARSGLSTDATAEGSGSPEPQSLAPEPPGSGEAETLAYLKSRVAALEARLMEGTPANVSRPVNTPVEPRQPHTFKTAGGFSRTDR